MTEFYYNHKKLRNWAFVSLCLLLIALGFTATTLTEIWLVTIIKIVALISCLVAFYVYLEPQRLAKIDDEGIIIDHNAKLKWTDIEKVERFGKCCCCCCGRKFLRFKLKKGVKYPLTLAQKISSTSKYGAFSIPLYAMTEEDGKAIETEIEKHLTAKPVKKTVKSKEKTSTKKEMVKKTIKKSDAKKTNSKKKSTPKKKMVVKK